MCVRAWINIAVTLKGHDRDAMPRKCQCCDNARGAVAENGNVGVICVVHAFVSMKRLLGNIGIC